MFTVPGVEHINIDVPASAVGSKRMVNVLVAVALIQPAFEAVRVKVTLPEVKSEALGV